MTKIVLEDFAKELKLIKVVAISRYGGHGDRSTRLFCSHKGFYEAQCLLTGHYSKRCTSLDYRHPEKVSVLPPANSKTMLLYCLRFRKNAESRNPRVVKTKS